MNTSRLEAFSDGVLAIIITIMVLELRPPESYQLSELTIILPKFIAYLFSFLVIAIYWNNHHHLMKATPKISAKVMWANMHLLFWLSLVPFATTWLGESNHYTHTGPVLLYSLIALFSGIAYYILSRSIIKANPNSNLVEIIGKDTKGLISLFVYIAACGFSFINTNFALALVLSTAVVWFIPDKRLESLLK